jgi:nitroimidazol reductase NimA-like FMN-containing flavoprotein (pyridoxamine 5'-phosphate oxidase superfamily)
MTQVDRNGLEVLDRADCIRLLRTVSLGRLGVTVGALPTILPINFRIDGDRILFRTGVGTKLDAATRGAVVAFEADDFDPMYHSGWSVVVTGVAREISDPDDRAMDTTPRWAPGQDERLVEVSMDEMSGRRLDGLQLQSGWALHDSA